MVADGEQRDPARQAVGSSGRGSQAGVARELSELAREMQAAATTGALLQRVVQIDRVQYEVGEGPCVDAATEHATVRSDDLLTDARWPRFAPRAADMGVRSMLSFQLFVEAGSMGALNVYAGPAGAFGEESESTGMLLAAHAAIAMTAARTEADLRAGLDARDVIGQAQSVNQKLRIVADHLAATGEIMTPPARRGRPEARRRTG